MSDKKKESEVIRDRYIQTCTFIGDLEFKLKCYREELVEINALFVKAVKKEEQALSKKPLAKTT